MLGWNLEVDLHTAGLFGLEIDVSACLSISCCNMRRVYMNLRWFAVQPDTYSFQLCF
jgi:hypothetical protein